MQNYETRIINTTAVSLFDIRIFATIRILFLTLFLFSIRDRSGLVRKKHEPISRGDSRSNEQGPREWGGVYPIPIIGDSQSSPATRAEPSNYFYDSPRSVFLQQLDEFYLMVCSDFK